MAEYDDPIDAMAMRIFERLNNEGIAAVQRQRLEAQAERPVEQPADRMDEQPAERMAEQPLPPIVGLVRPNHNPVLAPAHDIFNYAMPEEYQIPEFGALDVLYPYQVYSVHRMHHFLQTRNCVANMSDTGTGKTIDACALSIVLGMNLAVIAPKAVLIDWFETAQSMGIVPLFVINYESMKNGKQYSSVEQLNGDSREYCPYVDVCRGGVKVNTNDRRAKLALMRVPRDAKITYTWRFPPNTLIVVDEAHRGKNTLTATSAMCKSLKDALSPDCKMVLLSATITDLLTNFRTMAYLLGLAPFPKQAYDAWLRKITEGMRIAVPDEINVRIGRIDLVVNEGVAAVEGAEHLRLNDAAVINDEDGNAVRDDDVVRMQNVNAFVPGAVVHESMHMVDGCDTGTKLTISALHRVLNQMCAIRISIDDIRNNGLQRERGGFRRNTIVAKVYPVNPEIEDQIEAAYRDIAEALAKIRIQQTICVASGGCILALLTRARQKIESLKIPTAQAEITEQLTKGVSVVVFVNFKDTITKLFALLDPLVHQLGSFITKIEGGQSPEDREYNMHSFNSNRSILCFCNIAAGAVGISLHNRVVNNMCEQVREHSPQVAQQLLNEPLPPGIQPHYLKPRVSVIFPPWSGIMLKQALGRTCRAGMLTDTEQYIIYTRGRTSEAGHDCVFAERGIEELIARAVNTKIQTISILNDNDLRGIVAHQDG